MIMYTEEKNTLMLISLMKEHGIKKVIVSPGTTNVSLVYSLQQDSYFDLYSAYDERSAAYMACGMAAETGEVVALSCTQATASRNYFPGLTEAFYRKLPILAITSTQHLGRVGQGFQQAIDRTIQPKDTVKKSFQIPVIHTAEDEWYCNTMINSAFLELNRNGGGPVHLNLYTTYSRVFNQVKLPKVRTINRFSYFDFYKGNVPSIRQDSKIAIFVGNHKNWSMDLTKSVNKFCSKYDAVVCCDQVSGYYGKYRVNPNLLGCQKEYDSPALKADIIIHIGDVTGGNMQIKASETWRVDPNGEIMDTFKNQKYCFEIEEEYFFSEYSDLKNTDSENLYLSLWESEMNKVEKSIPELPFSNAWVAKNTISLFPNNANIHFGIYNSYRMWNMFNTKINIHGKCNTGGFGIDGCLSSMIGASIVSDSLVYGVFGDLAFFYDLNSLTNRHVGQNLRIMIINNGLGTEFKNPDNRAYKLGATANLYIAAEGHNGNKSKNLIKHYCMDLGFDYLSASNKEEYLDNVDKFINSSNEKSIVFEVFIDYENETKAYDLLMHSISDFSGAVKEKTKKILGDVGIKKVKSILGKN